MMRAFALVVGLLMTLSSTVSAQQSLLGSAAISGASAGSATVARIVVNQALQSAVVPTVNFDATQVSFGTTAAPTLIIPALAPGQPFTIDNVAGTSTATAVGNAHGTIDLPIGVLGSGGGASIGQAYSGSGNFGARTNVGSGLTLPSLLPVPPSLTIVVPAL